ncbi:hypothetical protein [Burkholderia sp. Ac-20379]|uniref:hypothetical protein n=1 Tax=Burkholderia sp. Ac-20379 TaxID=2703900 RepID=UPI00197DDEB1|nr:hypothetical protein [Burkholderia sp. Ac-20379]MBN3726009.1 hypothetical protein [Burkholderia sp. Ac-20379]
MHKQTNDGVTWSSRRQFLIATASSLLLSACITPQLFKDDHYTETVSRFMITADGKQLVVLGEQYHYIFALPDTLRAVLMSRYRESLKSSFFGFRVEGDAITGHYSTELLANAPVDEQQAATRDGFKSAHGKLSLEGELEGKRYTTSSFTQGLSAQSFNHPYKVYIREALSPAAMGLRLLATPVTVAADGVLLLGGVLLLPVAAVALSGSHTKIGPGFL